MKCSRCSSVYYCSKDCQRDDWKAHKGVCRDIFQANQHTLHKMEFDRIRTRYKLDEGQRADEIAILLTTGAPITPPDFASKFDMTVEEAVVFLEWIKVGVQFKEQNIDTARQAGFGK